MAAFTCQQTLAFVTEARAGDLSADTAVAVAGHLLSCDDCRSGILACHAAQTLMEEHSRGPDPQTAVDLAAHLVRCDDCRLQADGMREVQALLESVDIPASLVRQFAAATRERLTLQLRARVFLTPLGWGGLAYSDRGIVLVRRYYLRPEDAVEQLRHRLDDIILQERRRDDAGDSAARKLVAYHDGQRVRFDEPIDLSLVRPFTQQVLRATAAIPYGEVRPYAWVAREVGKPRATRAVGQALHINPVAPIIPCHRVIASDSSLGGYGGGLDVKKWLLRLEGYLP